MYRIALINMPFAAADIPSIALTQLKSMVEKEFGDRVSCDVLYLNLDFLNFLGPQLFRAISVSVQANTSGLGDWFFSAEAFPDKPDDPEAYLTRSFAGQRADLDPFKEQMLDKRRGVGVFLKSLIDRDQLTGYDLVGFTSMFCQTISSIAMAKALKKERPEIVTLMGGANCETPMGAVLCRNVPEMDFIFSGPSLETFPALVRHLLAGEEVPCHSMPGVLTQRKIGTTAPEQWREIGGELDIDVDLPLEYQDYFTALDKVRGAALTPKIPFETSRGCWWGERSHCTFCGLNGMTMKYRAMSPARALAQFQALFEKYSSRAVVFESVDNILPREYLVNVLPHLDTPEHAVLFYEVKADLKEREIAVLAQARVKHIQPGIEALATSTLKLMKKGTTSFQNIKFLMYCRYYGITPFWNLLIGFPREPEEVYEKYYRDLPLLTHLDPPSGVYPVRFDRYSPYHKLAEEYNLRLRPADFYGMIYPFPAADLEHFAYFFRDEDFQAPYIMSTARWLGRLQERIGHWQWRADGRDGGFMPELVFKEDGSGGWLVYDSRSGKAEEHRVGTQGVRVLHALTQQSKVARLAEKLPGMSEDDIAGEVEALQKLGLLFEEDGTYLSLVMRPEGELELPLAARDARELLPSVAGR
ncbi:MAG TPA: RiPP maturation radical SAM C-methyltransferase [Thermoanaerobaculia bacterium]|nr:RiPP maturation radical SAM C-methyltransferase [Thermoanaerobaculia bacterium]